MKKVQRSFTVEYKSGRRKTDPKVHSIWGNLDLKSAAKAVQDEAMPLLAQSGQGVPSDCEISLPIVKLTVPLLIPTNGHRTTEPATKETTMADENITIVNNDAPASLVSATDAPKKQRRPRAKTIVHQSASVIEPPVGKLDRQPRGRKPKLSEAVRSAKSAPVKREPKAVVVSTAARDDMTDLLQLEEENQTLRKMLAEKLRSENADLRKRLNLG